MIVIKSHLTSYLTLLLVLITKLTFCNEPLLDSAKSNYDNGAFAIAIDQYETVLAKGLNSANLHYNLGNAYFRNGQLGLSILNFEKALKLESSHENASFNLSLANTKNTDKFEIVPEVSFSGLLRGLNKSVSHNVLSIIGIILLLGSAGLFIVGKKEKRKPFIKIARITVLAGLLITFIGWQQMSSVAAFKAGIVLSPTSNVFSEPNEGSTLLFEVHEGTKMEVLTNSGEWINVKAPNNEIGWIAKNSLGEI